MSQAPAPSSTSVSALAARRWRERALEEGALRPGGVVLGQLRDLLEELAAALVVEPDGRDRLLLSLQALDRISLHLAAHLLGREVHVDGVGHEAQGSRASRTPLNAQRAPGGKKLR